MPQQTPHGGNSSFASPKKCRCCVRRATQPLFRVYLRCGAGRGADASRASLQPFPPRDGGRARPAGAPGACACARPAQADIPPPADGLWWQMTRPHQSGALAAAVRTSSLSITDLWTKSIKFCGVRRRQTEVGGGDLRPASSFSRTAPADVGPAGREWRSSPPASEIRRPGGRDRAEARPQWDSATERGDGKSTRPR